MDKPKHTKPCSQCNGSGHDSDLYECGYCHGRCWEEDHQAQKIEDLEHQVAKLEAEAKENDKEIVRLAKEAEDALGERNMGVADIETAAETIATLMKIVAALRLITPPGRGRGCVVEPCDQICGTSDCAERAYEWAKEKAE